MKDQPWFFIRNRHTKAIERLHFGVDLCGELLGSKRAESPVLSVDHTSDVPHCYTVAPDA